MQLDFPDPQNLFRFSIAVSPADGHYRGGRFVFAVEVSENYPIDPPKVKCTQRIYHPNIDLDGNVCLNILREDWLPVLLMGAVVLGLNFLFLELNPTDPLNKDAANMLVKNPARFARNVRSAICGLAVDGHWYDNVRT